MVDPKDLTDDQWRKKLSPEQFHVLREKGTERAFTGKYDKNKAAGEYVCAGCGQALFESDAKYDSGCGWPAFTAPAEGGAVAEHGPFMAVAGVGGFKQDEGGGDFHQQGKHLGHVDVADMRAFVIAPADVQADAVTRQAVQRVLQRFDMGRSDAQEVLVAELGEKHVPRQGEVGAIQLQVQPGIKDGTVFVAHRIGQRL